MGFSRIPVSGAEWNGNRKVINFLTEKKVLVTGGTGSFGQSFVAEALKQNPQEIKVFSRSEQRQSEMKSRFNDSRLKFLIGDIRDINRVHEATRNVDIVVHAAALKRIPEGEEVPEEFVKTNILGSLNLMHSCIENKVMVAFAISTDKAAHPTNLYGATKMVMEKAWLSANGILTRFSCSRYGNVIDSNGGVLATFKRQAKEGVPLTVTDKAMTRFWLTVESGVNFVISCLERMNGGEIFIPKGLPSVLIEDIAKAVCPKGSILYTGIRPGEKLAEQLFSEDEARHTVEEGGFYMMMPEGSVTSTLKSFTSTTNPYFLNQEQIRAFL